MTIQEIKNSSHYNLLREYEECKKMWELYSCNSLGYYKARRLDRIMVAIVTKLIGSDDYVIHYCGIDIEKAAQTYITCRELFPNHETTILGDGVIGRELVKNIINKILNPKVL